MHKVTLDDDGIQDDVYKMYNLPGPQTNSFQVTVNIESQDVLMEVDTGTSLSVISEMTYKSLSSAPSLQSTQAKLRTFTGESLGVLGSISVPYAITSNTNSCRYWLLEEMVQAY